MFLWFSFLFFSCICLCTGIPSSKPTEKKKQSESKKNKKAKKSKGIVVDELMAALKEDSAPKSKKTALNKVAPKHFNRAKRAKMEADEAAQFKNVFELNAFQSNPLDSIAQHIKNTVALAKL